MTNTLLFFGLAILLTIAVKIIYEVKCEKRKRQAKEYDNSIATIDFIMQNDEPAKPEYKSIRAEFDKLSRNPCCEKEKMAVKEMEFLKKYLEVAPEIIVTSFNGLLGKQNIIKEMEVLNEK